MRSQPERHINGEPQLSTPNTVRERERGSERERERGGRKTEPHLSLSAPCRMAPYLAVMRHVSAPYIRPLVDNPFKLLTILSDCNDLLIELITPSDFN